MSKRVTFRDATPEPPLSRVFGARSGRGRSACRQRLPHAPHPSHCAVQRGQHARHHVAARRREARCGPWAERHRRQPPGRERHRRHRSRGESAARRLHDAHHDRVVHGQHRALQEAGLRRHPHPRASDGAVHDAQPPAGRPRPRGGRSPLVRRDDLRRGRLRPGVLGDAGSRKAARASSPSAPPAPATSRTSHRSSSIRSRASRCSTYLTRAARRR